MLAGLLSRLRGVGLGLGKPIEFRQQKGQVAQRYERLVGIRSGRRARRYQGFAVVRLRVREAALGTNRETQCIDRLRA